MRFSQGKGEKNDQYATMDNSLERPGIVRLITAPSEREMREREIRRKKNLERENKRKARINKRHKKNGVNEFLEYHPRNTK